MKSIYLLLINIFMFSLTIDTDAQSKFKALPGPVFNEQGAVFDVSDADFAPNKGDELKAVFDIDRKSEVNAVNPLISSLHRYYNMHVRHGIYEEDIHLAFVVHGASTDHVLNNEEYRNRYDTDNPNIPFIISLAKKGVQMYVCGQSATYRGIEKKHLIPEVKMALSAMTVLTTLQMDGYAMIRF